MSEGFEIPLHRALTEPILLAGAPRPVAIVVGALATAVDERRAMNREDAHIMVNAGEKIRDALAKKGYAPR